MVYAFRHLHIDSVGSGVFFMSLFFTFLIQSVYFIRLIRPPDIVCRRTNILPGFLFFFLFFRQLISEIAEQNSTIFGHMVGSKCNLKMHVQNLWYPIPHKPGTQKSLFWTTLQLNGNFNSLYHRNERRYKQSGKCIASYKGSATSSPNDMNFGPQTASNRK